MKKHYTQMDSGEVQSLMNAVRTRTFALAPHATKRMGSRAVEVSQIKGMLTYSTIIEAHDDNGTFRVLVRGKVFGKWLCAVVDLTTGEIVTVYWNREGDHHQTIDMAPYSWKENMKIVLDNLYRPVRQS